MGGLAMLGGRKSRSLDFAAASLRRGQLWVVLTLGVLAVLAAGANLKKQEQGVLDSPLRDDPNDWPIRQEAFQAFIQVSVNDNGMPQFEVRNADRSIPTNNKTAISIRLHFEPLSLWNRIVGWIESKFKKSPPPVDIDSLRHKWRGLVKGRTTDDIADMVADPRGKEGDIVFDFFEFRNETRGSETSIVGSFDDITRIHFDQQMVDFGAVDSLQQFTALKNLTTHLSSRGFFGVVEYAIRLDNPQPENAMLVRYYGGVPIFHEHDLMNNLPAVDKPVSFSTYTVPVNGMRTRQALFSLWNLLPEGERPTTKELSDAIVDKGPLARLKLTVHFEATNAQEMQQLLEGLNYWNYGIKHPEKLSPEEMTKMNFGGMLRHRTISRIELNDKQILKSLDAADWKEKTANLWNAIRGSRIWEVNVDGQQPSAAAVEQKAVPTEGVQKENKSEEPIMSSDDAEKSDEGVSSISSDDSASDDASNEGDKPNSKTAVEQKEAPKEVEEEKKTEEPIMSSDDAKKTDEGVSSVASSDDSASDDPASNDASNDDSSDDASDEGSADDASNDKSASDDASNDKSASDDASNDKSASDDASNDKSASDDASNDKSASDDASNDKSDQSEDSNDENSDDADADDDDDNKSGRRSSTSNLRGSGSQAIEPES